MANSVSRRDFLYGLSSLGALRFFSLERTEPDLILHNGNVWTVDPRFPRAQAVAISDGRFLALGSNEEVLHLAGGRSKKIDLEGKFVMPGFIDAHAHPVDAGVLHLLDVDCSLPSIAEILSELRKRAAKTPPGEWVRGFRYDETKTSEQREITREDLDAAVPDHPVYVWHTGGHVSWVNSLGYKAAKVDESTPDPPGGQFDRDAATAPLPVCVFASCTRLIRILWAGVSLAGGAGESYGHVF